MNAAAKINASSLESPSPLPAEAVRQAAEENIALQAIQQKNYGLATEIYKSLIRENPYNPGFWRNLSIALRYDRHYLAALGCAYRAVSLDPASLGHAVNLADCLLPLDKHDEALALLSRVVHEEPENATYRHRYADALRDAGRFDEALAQARIACDLDSNNVEAAWQHAVVNLTLGNLSAGWKGYEARWKRGTLKEKSYKAPRWQGEDLAGKTILLHEEQGFGDTILAARYIPLVKQRGAHVILGCRTDLHALFKNIQGLDALTGGGSFSLDYHAPLMSLPGIFGTEFNTIPPPACLTPAETLPSAVTQLLGLRKDHFKVGIIWSGNPDFKDNHRRAVAFSRFLPLAEIPGVQLYSLQKGAPEKELREAGAESLVWELGSHLNNFAETAAVLEQLDLVIMTDSSVAHLAGSLGRPVWNLLNYSPSWLYLTKREDSPWYPSMRLFRQPTPGDWDSVFNEVATELKKALSLKQDGKWPVSKNSGSSQPFKDPKAIQSLKQKGPQLLREKKTAQAIECLTEVVKLDPGHAPSWSNLGSALRHMGKLEAAACCSKRALLLSPQYPAFLANHGNVLSDLNRLDEATSAYKQALHLKPDDAQLRYNYALALREAGRLQEAVNIFEDLYKKEPDNVELVWDAAMALLAGGNLKSGWTAFESRRLRPNMQRDRIYKTAPLWSGEDLTGKTILVYEEQGFGDTILCSRYIPLLHKRGAHVILECKPQLHRLFSGLPGISRLAEEGQTAGGFDYHIPMMSLPRLMGTDLHNIPAPPSSLHVPASLPPFASPLLARGKNKLKVGIVWSGNIDFPGNRKRAVSLERFLPLACIPNVQLYSLQKGPHEKDLTVCGATELILDIGSGLKDFSETASVLKYLDLIIMTDSSVAHLAGSLGVPVWNLLGYHPYWLYQTKGQDCPWYPSMRLFRQPVAGDWDSVFKEVTKELAHTVNTKKELRRPRRTRGASPASLLLENPANGPTGNITASSNYDLKASYEETFEEVNRLPRQARVADCLPLYQSLLHTGLDDPDVWGNMGHALHKLGNHAAAAAALSRSLELKPESVRVLHHYASCLIDLGKEDQCVEACKAGLSYAPDDFELNYFYAGALMQFGRNREALQRLERILLIKPGHAGASRLQKDINLRLGNFEVAWKHRESAQEQTPPQNKVAQKITAGPRWKGEKLENKTILIYGDEGFGDFILFSRYLPLVKERFGGRVILGCPPALRRLFQNFRGADRVVDRHTIDEPIDCYILLKDLPQLFETTLETIPPPAVFQEGTSQPAAEALLQKSQNRFKVGIVWSGSATYPDNKYRAATLKRFLSLAEIPGIQLYSLQKGPQEQEIAQCGAESLVLPFGPLLHDFADTAAILKQLDLVIMTDSSVAHLAGALGVPVWNLLFTRGYWIYLVDREDSPWYPSMRLFRQPRFGDWDSVFEKVATELSKAVQLKKAGKWPPL